MSRDLVIHSVSFASEGPPHDGGLPLGESMLNSWGGMCITGGATTFRGYTPRILRAEGDEWSVQQFSDEHRMPHNPGYHTVGLGAWRAVILRKSLERARDGEVVVVHCVNFKRQPQIVGFALNIRKYVNTVVSFTDLYSPPHEEIGNWTTNDVLSLIPDSDKREVVAHAPGGICRLIIAVATPQTRDFARLFERTIKQNPFLLSPYGAVPYPGTSFGVKKAEQSVFNVLAYREGLFPIKWRGTWIEKLLLWPNEADGLESVLRYRSSLLTPVFLSTSVSQASSGGGEVTCIISAVDPSVSWDSAIIIYGPQVPTWTATAIRGYSEKNSESRTLIVVSTSYVEEDEILSDLVEDGKLVYLFIQPRNADSCRFGIQHAHDLGIPIVLCCRSDTFLGMQNISKNLETRYLLEFSLLEVSSLLKGRIITGDYIPKSQSEGYWVSHLWLFGYINDVLQFFSSSQEWEGAARPEVFLTESWMRMMGINSLPGGNMELLARYFIVVDSSDVEFLWNKRDSYDTYTAEGRDYIRSNHANFHSRRAYEPVTHEFWKSQFQRLCQLQKLTRSDPSHNLATYSA